MDVADDVGPREHQKVAVALELARVIAEAIAAEVGLAELARLDLRAHGAVEHQDALLHQRPQRHLDLGLVKPIFTHDLCATAVMTWKWGSRFSRLETAQLSTVRPTFCSIFLSAGTVKPLLTC